MEICNTKSKIHQPMNEIYRSAEQDTRNMLNFKCNTSIGYQLNTIINTKCEIKSTKGTKNMLDWLIYTNLHQLDLQYNSV